MSTCQPAHLVSHLMDACLATVVPHGRLAVPLTTRRCNPATPHIPHNAVGLVDRLCPPFFQRRGPAQEKCPVHHRECNVPPHTRTPTPTARPQIRVHMCNPPARGAAGARTPLRAPAGHVPDHVRRLKNIATVLLVCLLESRVVFVLSFLPGDETASPGCPLGLKPAWLMYHCVLPCVVCAYST